MTKIIELNVTETKAIVGGVSVPAETLLVHKLPTVPNLPVNLPVNLPMSGQVSQQTSSNRYF